MKPHTKNADIMNKSAKNVVGSGGLLNQLAPPRVEFGRPIVKELPSQSMTTCDAATPDDTAATKERDAKTTHRFTYLVREAAPSSQTLNRVSASRPPTKLLQR